MRVVTVSWSMMCDAASRTCDAKLALWRPKGGRRTAGERIERVKLEMKR
jgi:hypothetical protein